MRGTALLKGTVSTAAMVAALAAGAGPVAAQQVCVDKAYGVLCREKSLGAKGALSIWAYVPGTSVVESNGIGINVSSGSLSAIQIHSDNSAGAGLPTPPVSFTNMGALNAFGGGINAQAGNTVSIVNEGRISGFGGGAHGISVQTGQMFYSDSLAMMMPGPSGAIAIDNRAAITAAVTGANYSSAIYANSMASDITILNSGKLQGGDGASVIAAYSGWFVPDQQGNPVVINGGNVSVTNSNSVTASGPNGRGINAGALTGAVTVDNSGRVAANGDFSDAIFASSGGMADRPGQAPLIVDGMPVSVSNSGQVGNTGNWNALGIRANSNGSSVTVTNTATGIVSTSGGFSAAIQAGNMFNGAVRIDNAGLVNTTGMYSTGIEAYSSGELRDQNNNVVLTGMSGDVTVNNIGKVTTSGDGSSGIQAFSGSGRVTIVNDAQTPAAAGGGTPAVGRISTNGIDATGIGGYSRTGDVDITNKGVIVTSGMGSAAISAGSDMGAVTVTNAAGASIIGRGDYSAGIQTDTGGNGPSTALLTTQNQGAIKMYGAGSYGISTHSSLGTNRVGNTGNIVVGATAVTDSTGGVAVPAPIPGQSIGIFATSDGGNVEVTSSGKVRAYGDDSYGIVGVSLGGQSVRIDIQQGGFVQGGTGSNKFGLAAGVHDVTILGSAGIGIAGGVDNSVSNAGTITGLNGVAIAFGEGTWSFGPGMDITLPAANNTITNHSGGKILGDILLGSGNDGITNEAGGTITGSVDMGKGQNSFTNYGTFNSGAYVKMGAGNTLTNLGVMSPGGKGVIGITTVMGNFSQTGAGQYLVDINPTLPTYQNADQILVTGSMNLGGTVRANFLDTSGGVAGRYLIGGSIGPKTGTAYLPRVGATVGYDMWLENYAATAADPFPAGATGVFLNVAQKGSLKTVAANILGSTNVNPSTAGNVGSLSLALSNAESGGLLTSLTSQLRLSADNQSGLSAMMRMMPLDQAAQISRTTSSSLAFGSAMRNCATSVADAKLGESRANDQSCAWGRYSFASLQVSDVPYAVGLRDDGYDSTSAGRRSLREQANVAYGSQTALGNGWSLGAASAYETLGFGSSDGSAGIGSSQGERAIAGLVLKHEKGPWQTSLNVIGSYGWYDNDRATLTGTAHAEQQVAATQSGLRLAYQVDSGPAYVRPMVDLNATFLRLGAYSEQGAGASNLALASADKWIMSVAPGVEVGATLTGFGWTVKPYARAGVSFASGDQMAMSASFVSAPSVGAFMVSSRLDSVMADIEAGVNLLSLDGISAKLSYQGHIGTVSEDHTGGLKVQMPF